MTRKRDRKTSTQKQYSTAEQAGGGERLDLPNYTGTLTFRVIGTKTKRTPHRAASIKEQGIYSKTTGVREYLPDYTGTLTFRVMKRKSYRTAAIKEQ